MCYVINKLTGVEGINCVLKQHEALYFWNTEKY